MTDDLVARLRHTTERMGRECSVPNFDLWNDHSNACLEAADRLEAAEARVRELEAQLADQRAMSKYNREQAEKAERALAEAYERAAKVAASYDDGRLVYDSQGHTMLSRHGNRISAAIRKLAQEVKHEAE